MELAPMAPVALALDMVSGALEPATSHVRRCVSDMRGMYADSEAERALLAGDDPLVYEVLQYDVPNDPGQLLVCTTILYPGRVGNEYFMTKGHYHEKVDRAEVYLGLQGHGMVLMQTDGRSEYVEMGPGTIAYVPPYWAHRSVNVGSDQYISLAIYPGDAGHDYAAIERSGFNRRVIEQDGKPAIVPA
jgi:glucose-6-phosphate isomerase, archaeal